MDHRDLCLAVLIDADNAPSGSIREVLEEISVYGSPTIKRIYGDWTKPNLSSWKKLLLEHAITPIQQYGYTTGKNSTDSAMIIDAMDILYSNRVDGFVLVSSDSDFTRLATRLREAGMKVIGIGEKKTPKPFIVACDKFIYVEVIRAAAEEAARQAEQEQDPEPEPEKPRAAKPRKPQEPGVVGTLVASASPPPEDSGVVRRQKLPKLVVACIASSIEDLADEDGYVLMGELANLIMKKQPDFDPRNFGYRKLTQLVKSHSRFEVEMRPDPSGHGKQVYVRDRQAKQDTDD